MFRIDYYFILTEKLLHLTKLKIKVFMKRNILITLFFFIGLTIHAQEVIATQGDSYSNSGGSIDFTIGEVMIQTLTTTSNVLTQGFHQTNLTVLGIDDYDPTYLAKVFPNPTNEILNIDISNFNGLSYEIYDVSGRQLSNTKLKTKTTSIAVDHLANGMYLLVLKGENNQKLKTYRILKN